jgi:hypothetical protein
MFGIIFGIISSGIARGDITVNNIWYLLNIREHANPDTTVNGTKSTSSTIRKVLRAV